MACLLASGAMQVAACQPAMPARTVSLRMKGSAADAEVTIDDIDVGPLGYVAVRGVALPPGRHRVTVEKSGFFPWDKLITAEKQPIYLDVVLVPVPD